MALLALAGPAARTVMHAMLRVGGLLALPVAVVLGGALLRALGVPAVLVLLPT